MKSIPYHLQESNLKQTGIVKIDGKTHIVYRENRTNNLYLQYNLPFETDADYANLHKALLEIKRMTFTKILKVHCVNVDDRRLTCAPSSFRLFVDYHEKKLEDIVHEKRVFDFFDSENKIWKFLFSILEILEFFADNKIDCNYVHTRSIFYNPSVECFGLIHPAFFRENNFYEALAGNLHFCSPELYFQILSKNKKFMLVENDKSNTFSLALILLYSLYSPEVFKIDEIFNGELISVNTQKIKAMIKELSQKNISQLLICVLLDMTNEFEHVRISPSVFMRIFRNERLKFESTNFHNYDSFYDTYQKLNHMSGNTDLNGKMIDAFGFDENDDLNLSGHLNNDEIVNNLKKKAQPFSNKQMIHD